MSDTIFALASAPGRAGIAVVRVSGPAAGETLRRLCGSIPAPRRASLRALADPESGEILDRGLVLWFPGPRSYTGEDLAELHLHGGRGVVGATLAAVGRLPGLRAAEPGEFTRRAFLNGKIDLTAAEGLADLIAADTEAQRRQALRQLDGELGRLYDDWRQRLLRALARLEASIDFPEEGLPEGLRREVDHDILGVEQGITQHIDDKRRGERLRDGVSVALLGAPNAGKSSLLNLLARRDAAIVSTIAGTTRDVIEIHLDLGGYPVVLADTAGLRAAGDEIEVEGVRRALKRAAAADLKVALFDAAHWPALDESTLGVVDADTLAVVNKCDLKALPADLVVAGRPAAAISVLTGAGIEAFLDRLVTAVAERAGLAEGPSLTRARHRQALGECLACLGRAQRAGAAELKAEDLRLATRALGRITGRVDVEDVLDAIFREFCIGK